MSKVIYRIFLIAVTFTSSTFSLSARADQVDEAIRKANAACSAGDQGSCWFAGFAKENADAMGLVKDRIRQECGSTPIERCEAAKKYAPQGQGIIQNECQKEGVKEACALHGETRQLRKQPRS